MPYILSTINILQALGIGAFGLILTAFTLYFLFKQSKSIQASDGTRFSTEAQCREYETILLKINSIYQSMDPNAQSDTYGIQSSFISLLFDKGFKEPKTLIKYKNDFQIITDILNASNILD